MGALQVHDEIDVLLLLSPILLILGAIIASVLGPSCQFNPLGQDMARQRRELYFPEVYSNPIRRMVGLCYPPVHMMYPRNRGPRLS